MFNADLAVVRATFGLTNPGYDTVEARPRACETSSIIREHQEWPADRPSNLARQAKVLSQEGDAAQVSDLSNQAV